MSSICWADGKAKYPELDYLIGKYGLVRVYIDEYGGYYIHPNNVGSVLNLDYDASSTTLSLVVTEASANSEVSSQRSRFGDAEIISDIRIKPHRYKGYPMADDMGAMPVYLSGSSGCILVRRCEWEPGDFDNSFNAIEKEGDKLFEIVRINDFELAQ